MMYRKRLIIWETSLDQSDDLTKKTELLAIHEKYVTGDKITCI